MEKHTILDALQRAHRLDQQGRFHEADRLTDRFFRAAQSDENMVGKIGNALSNGGYAVQNWSANAFLGGGQNAKRVVDQIDYFTKQMETNTFLRDPNQKSALMAALAEARQIAYSLTSDFNTQQQQTQQQKESQLATDYVYPSPKTSAFSAVRVLVRSADDRSIPVVQNDINNLINFANQAYGGRDQQQVQQLVGALGKARAVMMGQGYTPAAYSPSGLAQANNPSISAILNPTSLNKQQKQFLDRYMEIGIAQGREKMLQTMNANPWHTEPFKNMVVQFWDKQVGPRVQTRKQQFSTNGAAQTTSTSPATN